MEGPRHFAGEFLLGITEIPRWIKDNGYAYLTRFWQRTTFGRLVLAG
jgi:hypothetical protein